MIADRSAIEALMPHFAPLLEESNKDDHDNDGITDLYDLDDDNDGIYDLWKGLMVVMVQTHSTTITTASPMQTIGTMIMMEFLKALSTFLHSKHWALTHST